MRAAGVEVVVPLVAQGELIGVLILGPRRSERPYSLDDRRLLDNLAGNAAAAIRVAHLVRNQEEQARSRERIDQELKVAQLIQKQFLPQEAPAPDGWSVVPHYRPAREVGGDFYDFIPLPDGQIGLVVGDVTDKGVPAAMVMATTHSILRTDAPRLGRSRRRAEPGQRPPLRRDATEHVRDLPVRRPRTRPPATSGSRTPVTTSRASTPPDGVVEPRATGMPLGLLPGLTYDEQEVTIAPGDTVLLYSDGIVEAHNPERELYGFPRIRALVGRTVPGDDLVQDVLDDLEAFTGSGWEQEDDITLVSIARAATHRRRGGPCQRLAPADHRSRWPAISATSGSPRSGSWTRSPASTCPRPVVDRLRTVVAEADDERDRARQRVPLRGARRAQR